MFSKQISSLMNIRSLADLQQALRNLLGNCAQPLEHRGPVTIDVTRPDKATDAGLTVRNGYTGSGTPDGSNGFAIKVPEGIARFDGPIWPLFRPNKMKFVLLEDMPATAGAQKSVQIVSQSPEHDDVVNDLVGTTAILTNDIGYWSGSTGDAGEADIWYTDLKNDAYEWHPRVIKAAGAGSEITDDADAVCTHGTCKPYYWTVALGNLGSGGTCQELNGKTFLLSYSSACVWKVDGIGLGGTCGYDEIRLTASASGGNTRLTLAIYNASNVQQASTYTDVSGTPADLCVTVFTNANSDFELNWTTVGPPPVITGPPTITLTPYLPSFLNDATCSCCSDDHVPATYNVDISGTTNGTCTNCANWDGTYVLTRNTSLSCYYTVTVDKSSGTGTCDSDPNRLKVITFFPCTGAMALHSLTTGSYRHADVSFTAPARCWEWYEEVASSIVPSRTICDVTTATFTVNVGY